MSSAHTSHFLSFGRTIIEWREMVAQSETRQLLILYWNTATEWPEKRYLTAKSNNRFICVCAFARPDPLVEYFCLDSVKSCRLFATLCHFTICFGYVMRLTVGPTVNSRFYFTGMSNSVPSFGNFLPLTTPKGANVRSSRKRSKPIQSRESQVHNIKSLD